MLSWIFSCHQTLKSREDKVVKVRQVWSPVAKNLRQSSAVHPGQNFILLEDIFSASASARMHPGQNLSLPQTMNIDIQQGLLSQVFFKMRNLRKHYLVKIESFCHMHLFLSLEVIKSNWILKRRELSSTIGLWKCSFLCKTSSTELANISANSET